MTVKITAGLCAFFIFFACFQVYVFSEEALIVLVREVWQWDTGVSNIYNYDLNGDVARRIVEQDGKVIYGCTFSYDYDDLDRKSIGYLEDTDGDTAVYTYTYNKNNQIVTEVWEWIDSESGAFNAYYEYNDGGDVVMYIVEDNQSGEIVYSYSINYEYDDNGRKIKAYVENSYNETAVITYEYEKLPVIE